MDSPSADDTSGAPKDIFSDPLEDIFSDPLSDTNSEPQKGVDTKISSPGSDEAIDLFSDPLDDVISPADVQNPVPDLLNVSLSNSAVEPPKSKPQSDVITKSSHKNDVADHQKDIFEDPASKGASAKKPASSDLFDEDDDEDLFEEPFKAVTKKSSGPPVDIFTEVKSEGKVKPQGKQASADLFTEDGVTSAGASSRTNGVHSEEQDLFTGMS